MENEEIKNPEGATPSPEEIKQELEAIKAEKEKLLSTQDEINKLQQELIKQKAELEELKNYKFPNSPVQQVIIEDSYEKQMEDLKAHFDKALEDKTMLLHSPISPEFWKTELYETYRHLPPEERTVAKLKQLRPKTM